MQPVVTSTCPHLGMQDEPGGYYLYPSTDNRCYHCKRPATPSLAHQEAFCLRGAQKDCPVYWQPKRKAFPSSLQAAEAVRSRRFASLETVLVLVIGVMAIGYAAFRFVPQALSLSAGALSPPATAITVPSMTPLPMPTRLSALPTSTLIPTSTAVLQTHALDVPFVIDGHELLLHRLGAGDMFDTIDAAYKTTPDVLRALNYSVRDMLFANIVIVIAPGLKVVDPTLPSFKVRQVEQPTATIDDLVQEYHVEAAVLRHYNGCSDACSLSAGDWILIPVIANSTATP